MKRMLRISLRVIIILFVIINILAVVHSYKFIHFYNPGEVTVKDNDKKNFWDHTKDILFGFNNVKEVNILKPDSAFETVYLTTGNGLKLEGWYVPVTHPVGTVALFHGHGDKKSDVLPEAYAFMKMGYNIFLLDFRASGSSEGHTCTIGYNEAEDVKLVYDHLRKRGEKYLILWGMSMGAATITTALERYNDCKPQKVILELPFSSMERAIKAKLRLMGLPQEPTAALLSFWAGVETGFWVFDHKPSEYVKKINCPVLLQFGKNDLRVTTQEREDIIANLPPPKKVVIYDLCGHESLLTKEPAKWLASVSSFLSSNPPIP